MKNKICPICRSKNSIVLKDFDIKVHYCDKTSFGKRIKIWECKNCGYNVERKRNSFDKSYKREFIKLRNKTVKEMIKGIKTYFEFNTLRLQDVERELYLDNNYFYDILNERRKIRPEDASLISIIYNFPFIVKCAAYNFEIQKCVEILKEFISQFDNIDWEEYSKRNKNRVFPHNIDEFYKSKHDCTKMPIKEELEKVNK